jgi:hypothetical protein
MRSVIRTTSVIGVLVMVSLVVPVSAQRVSDLELKLKEALHKQQVEGDVSGAIDLYRQIVATAGGNRVVAAKALLEMASLYERLGRETAETVYQQIGASTPINRRRRQLEPGWRPCVRRQRSLACVWSGSSSLSAFRTSWLPTESGRFIGTPQ